MSTSEQPEQPNIIRVEHEYNRRYEKSTNQLEIDLYNQPTIPVSQKTYVDETYDAFHNSEEFVVIRINGTNTLVIVEYPLQSKPLHIHIIEHLIHVCDDSYDDDLEVCGNTIFVIFNDHILRICLTNTSNVSSFKECKTDFSFRISRTESSSFTMIEDERNNRLRACLVSDETSWKKVKLFEICLFHDDERLFSNLNEYFFRLPPNFTVIETIFNYFDNNLITLYLTGNSTNFEICIHYGKTIFDYHASPIFLLNDYERCILATSRQLKRFQMIGFEIVATMYVCPFEDHDELPEIPKFINALLELNKYHRSQLNSDRGSDSD